MRWLPLVLLVPLAGCVGTSDVAIEPPVDAWPSFEADRVHLYGELAPPFVECFQRRDSLIDPLSPIFHGCLDWHSAVHAAYSHLALHRRTGDPAYLELVEGKLSVQGVPLLPAEHLYQQAKGAPLPLTENPYGFGWFLILARERELMGEQDMREMADYAAAMMRSWYQERLESGDAWEFILHEAHPNYSWSLINLDAWARHTGDVALQEEVRRFSLPLLDGDCPVAQDKETAREGFQPACLMRLAAVAHIWGDHAADWVAKQIPDGFHVPPVSEPANCHAGGLNFTRAFALYQLHWATNSTQHRDNYAELVRHHVDRPHLYTGSSYLDDPGYLCYGHWVAQFGVRAISLSYEERPATPEAQVQLGGDPGEGLPLALRGTAGRAV